MNRQFPLGRVAWIAVLVLSPLAYLGSFQLARLLPSRNSTITITRESAIQAAVAFAKTRGIDATGWKVSGGAEQHRPIAILQTHVRIPAVEQVTAASILKPRLSSPATGEWIRVNLTPTNRVVGFSTSQPQAPMPVDDAAAQKIATALLREMLGPSSEYQLPAPRVRYMDSKRQQRIFTWRAQVPGLPQAHTNFQVEMTGDRPTSEDAEVVPDDSYLNQFRPASGVKTGVQILGAVYLALMAIFGLVRYAHRAIEKEVSHRRTILVAAVFLTTTALAIFFGPEMTMSVNGAPPTPVQKVFLTGFTVLLFSAIGLLFGSAYGAGEGDVRAVYPGKLTSLDALLCGRIFTSNVARSILAGGAFAGAMFLLQNVALLATHAWRPPDDHDLASGLFMVFPLAEAFSDTSLNALAIAGYGLLLPIAFLRPRIKREWLLYVLVPLFSMLSAVIFSSDSFSWRSFIITVLVSVTVACVPFFYGDLLAAISGVLALDMVSKICYRGASSPQWAEIFQPLVYVGVVFLLAQVWIAWRGSTAEESEVRPLYAHRLAEHLSLRAEIGAARLAQLRLLPDAPPSISGLSIAGSCIPAREVGGDFYDFYPLDDRRLGVFIAEGGNRELGSAMPIALAKGYLLYTSGLDLSPVEVLRRLRELLGETLHREGSSISMLYAVIDSRSASVRFARTGNSPRLAVNGHPAVEEVAAAGPNAALAIQHGAATLAPDDSLVFYTDGLALQIREERRQPVEQFLARTAAALPHGTAAELHSAILNAAIRRKNDPPPDDVTAVVIRLTEPQARALEVVA